LLNLLSGFSKSAIYHLQCLLCLMCLVFSPIFFCRHLEFQTLMNSQRHYVDWTIFGTATEIEAVAGARQYVNLPPANFAIYGGTALYTIHLRRDNCILQSCRNKLVITAYKSWVRAVAIPRSYNYFLGGFFDSLIFWWIILQCVNCIRIELIKSKKLWIFGR